MINYTDMRSFAFLSFSLALVAQEPGTVGYSVSPLVIKDEACARDYLKASSATGLELRKRMAELVTYGCMEKTSHVYDVVLAKPKRIANGGKSVLFQSVTMFQDLEMEALARGDRRVSDWADLGEKKGLILDRDFLRYSQAQMEAVLKDSIRRNSQPK